MKAITLAAAKSEKLSPFSDSRPKCMLPIAGEYILETILKNLKKAGVDEVWIVVNHYKEVIRKRFRYGRDLGLKIKYIVQPEIGGIGHAVSLCEKVLENDDHFLLVYGDALMSGNYFKNLLEKFQRTGPAALAAVTHPSSDGAYGNIYLSHNMKISKFIEKPSDARLSNYIFGGSFILPRDCFDFLKNNNLDMVAYYQKVIAEKQMDVFLWDDSWIDISRPWHILLANRMMMKSWSKAVIPNSVVIDSNVKISGAVRFGENARVSSGSSVIGPCYIGSNVYIGNNCLIRRNSSIGPNCKIGYSAEIKNSVLFGNTDVGRLSFIGDSVLGENVQLGSGVMTVNYDTLGRPMFFRPAYGGEEALDTKLSKLGAFIGDDSIVGTGHTIAPGTSIMPKTTIPDHISISSGSLSAK